jgi:hypothetical protein
MANKTRPTDGARVKKPVLGRATGRHGHPRPRAGAAASVFTVFTPQAAQTTKVKVVSGVGFICARGVAISDMGEVPSAVWARVYATATPNVPASPPTDNTTFGVIPVQAAGGTNPLGYWNFDQTNFRELPGAQSDTSTQGLPNTLVLWFTWPDIGNVALSVPFFGKTDTATECS